MAHSVGGLNEPMTFNLGAERIYLGTRHPFASVSVEASPRRDNLIATSRKCFETIDCVEADKAVHKVIARAIMYTLPRYDLFTK